MKLLHALKRQITASAATLAVAVIVCGASAADLTVAQGDSQTISANATYGSVVVNGNLSVADGVTLTCTSLTVADNIGAGNTATLTVGDGASVIVTGSDKTKIDVGSGRAEVYLGTGASFSAEGYFNFCYGHDESLSASSEFETQALLVMGTNSSVQCGTDFCFGHDGTSSKSVNGLSGIKADVRLDKGAVLSTKRIHYRLPTSGRILFNGGEVRQTGNYTGGGFVAMPTSWKNISLYLDGTNGCPISFNLPDRGGYPAFASFGSNSRRLVMRGDGGFLKTGAGVFPLVNSLPGNSWGTDANLRFLFSGDFVISEGGFSVATSPTNNVFRAEESGKSRPVDIVVKNGAIFDLAGCDIVVNSITANGSGIVTNSNAATAKVTVGVLDDGRDSTLARVFPGMPIVKQGSAALSICGAEIDSVDVQGGTLVLKDRASMGYPFYRFQVDAINTDETNQRVNVNEFAFVADGVDVTRPYARLYHNASGTSTITNPVFLVDGDISTTYYDLRISSSDPERRARVGITLEYDKCLAVDAYRWAPFTASSHKTDPAAWRVLGGFSTTDLAVLDQVTGFRVSDVVDGWNSTNFVFTSGESSVMHIGTLTLADGVNITTDGARVSCDSLNAGSPCSLNVIGDKSALKGELIAAASCSGAGNIAGWNVSLNGESVDRRLCFANGAVRLVPNGFVLSYR